MYEIKKQEKKLITSIYQELGELNGYLGHLNDNSFDADTRKYLEQIKDKLAAMQSKIIETVVKDAIEGYHADKKADIGNDISLEKASALIAGIERKARTMGLNVVTAVYNRAANPVAIHCMDDSYIASYDVAVNKAYTSVALKMSTSALKKLSQPGGDLYGIQHTNQGRIVIFGGGEPLIYNGRLIGGLGVSGGSEEEDTFLAEFGRNILKEVMTC